MPRPSISANCTDTTPPFPLAVMCTHMGMAAPYHGGMYVLPLHMCLLDWGRTPNSAARKLNFAQMSRRYDAKTTTFSPEGRLFQVEYAMEAIAHAGTSLGVVCAADGILLAAERKVSAGSKLLDARHAHEKIFTISDHIMCVVAGISADANILVDAARLAVKRYEFAYGGEPMPVEQLVRHLCDTKQSYTQHGGMRPFGVAFLVAGWDRRFGFQLYQTDPSGNYSGWKATCIGTNSATAQSIFKTDYPEDDAPPLSMAAAEKMAVKVLEKTLDSAAADALSGDKVEVAVLSCDAGRCSQKFYAGRAVDNLVKAIRARPEPAVAMSD